MVVLFTVPSAVKLYDLQFKYGERLAPFRKKISTVQFQKDTVTISSEAMARFREESVREVPPIAPLAYENPKVRNNRPGERVKEEKPISPVKEETPVVQAKEEPAPQPEPAPVEAPETVNAEATAETEQSELEPVTADAAD